jgi:lipase
VTAPTAPTTPVVLLHGLTDSAACWPLVLDHLAGGPRRVVALDARGHGGVPLPDEPFTIAALAADAAAALREIDLGPALVVGHSMGGVTAEELALTAPELVAGLLLEDPAWHERPEAGAGAAESGAADADDPGPAEDGAQDAEGRPVWLADALPGLAGLTVEQVAARGRRDNPRWSAAEVDGWARAKTGIDPRLARVPHEWRGRAWVEALADVRVPVTLLTAAPGLGVVTRRQVSRAAELLGTAPEGRLTAVEVPGVGHNIRREAPAAFLAALDAALATADRG